jgi:hypothetical protein
MSVDLAKESCQLHNQSSLSAYSLCLFSPFLLIFVFLMLFVLFSQIVTCDWDEGSDGFRAQRITTMIEQVTVYTHMLIFLILSKC